MNNIINGVVSGISLYIGWQIGKVVYPPLANWCEETWEDIKVEMEKE